MNQSSASANETAPNKQAKLWTQLILGAVFGAGAMMLALAATDDLKVERLAVDEIIALGVGVIYLIMGVFVGLGILFPRPGSKLLNVENEEEIYDQRRLLGWSAVGAILVGASMLVLVGASPSLALLSPVTAAILFGLCMAVCAATSFLTRNDQDEFGHRISSDSGIAALFLITTLFGCWAVLAHLGLAPMFSALAFVSGILGLYMVAIFYVAGKRGLIHK